MLFFTLHLASCLALAPVPDVSLSPALKELQGEWRAVYVEEKGDKWDDKEEVAEVVLEITGDVLIYKRNPRHIEKFRIQLDPTKKPAWIDLRLIAENVDPAKAHHAIYSLNDGKLKLCLDAEFTANDPKDRPERFETGGRKPGQGQLLVVMERIKKK